ncbi:envelope stress response membrane protein PspB [Sandaracinobacteroides sp. A072]|uniref:envelope stress response membrane protein PspB n=1 Tax=Sandaracinobacteroides sp. A072 TaxID=3461146 RepID=UPI0040419940
MDAIEAIVPVTAIAILFVGLPWLILHYVTKWKQASSLTREDEDLLDDLHDIARRLDDRMTSIERIIAADRTAGETGSTPRLAELHQPEFRPQDQRAADPWPQALRKDI